MDDKKIAVLIDAENVSESMGKLGGVVPVVWVVWSVGVVWLVWVVWSGLCWVCEGLWIVCGFARVVVLVWYCNSCQPERLAGRQES